MSLWLSVSPPPGLLAGGDEGNSEIDVAIESPSWVWFIEAKYRSDIETGTKTRPERDQVLRNIDVGSYYARTRDFFFSLLVVSPETSPLGAAAVGEYSDFSKTRALLQAHRSDRLTNLRAVTLLTWLDMAAVLTDARDSVVRIDERHYADRSLAPSPAVGRRRLLGVHRGRLTTVRTGPRTPRMVPWIPAQNVVMDRGTKADRLSVSDLYVNNLQESGNSRCLDNQ